MVWNLRFNNARILKFAVEQCADSEEGLVFRTQRNTPISVDGSSLCLLGICFHWVWGIGGPTVTTKMVARGFLMLKTTKKIWRIKKFLTYLRNETKASNYKTLQRANNIGDDLRLCYFWWLVCAISLFRLFAWRYGAAKRRKTPREKTKKTQREKLKKTPREKTK